MNPTMALALEIFGAVAFGFGIGHIHGYWQGCKVGTRIGMKALDEYHEHTMQSLRSLR